MKALHDDVSFVDVLGMRIRVREDGEGEPLLMIMGIGGNLDMWRPLAEKFTGRRLIMFDFPGSGSSGPSRLLPFMGVNALFAKALLRRLGHDRVDVLGWSWGGLLAQHLAVQHSSSVRRLVLAATNVGLGGLPARPRVVARMLTPRRYYSREYFTKIAPELYGGRFRQDPALAHEEANRRLGRPPTAAGYLGQLLALWGYSTLPALPFIKAETLIIAGDDDPIVPAYNQHLLAKLIPSSVLRIFEGAGHLLLLDSADAVAPVVLDFLEQPEAGPPL